MKVISLDKLRENLTLEIENMKIKGQYDAAGHLALAHEVINRVDVLEISDEK